MGYSCTRIQHTYTACCFSGRRGFCFQLEVLDWFQHLYETRLESQQHIIIVERSSRTALKIFSENLFENSLINEHEYSLLQLIYSITTRWQPKHILYIKFCFDTHTHCFVYIIARHIIRTPVKICMERILARDRSGEEKINSKLIQSLHDLHEEQYAKKPPRSDTASHIYCIDGSQSISNVKQNAVDVLISVFGLS